MSQVTFRFYGELNDFLPAERHQVPISYGLVGPTAVKHPIESLGIPHTEVALILANGSPVDFSYLIRPGDHFSVYPVFFNVDVSSLPRLRPALSSPPRFIIDNHLGKLADYLRLLGFDTIYHNNYSDEELAELAHREERVLLTRDRGLLKRKLVVHGYCLRTKEPRDQLQAVLHRFDLHPLIDPWKRCIRCNGLLRLVSKESILDRLEPKTKKYYHEFRLCQECGQIYWKGSHYEALKRIVEAVMDPAPKPD